MAPPSRRPKNKHNPSHDTKITRRLRIVYDDPDATDNSSDEDEHFEKPKKIKRIVRELALPPIGNTVFRDETSGESSSYNDLNKAKTASMKREPSCKYRGVRMRKWGSWAAEIRNPMIKSGREWIGTFNTAEEASRAYEKRYLEIREEMAKSEKMKSSNNNNVTNPEKSSYDYFVSSDHSLDDSESDMSHTSSSFLPELNTSDFNLIENGNVSSNEAVETNVMEGEFANLEGEFADLAGEFAELNMPDLSVLDMAPLPLSPPPVVGAANPSRFEFDCLTFDGFGECYDDLGGLEDIQICGIDDDKGPIELPDFDFNDFGADEITGWIEEPSDIPCL